MSAGSLARRYAKALLQLGEEDKSVERIGTETADLAAAMESSQELSDTLTNPLFPRSDRQRVLEAILQKIGAGKNVVNFALLLLDRERLGEVVAISRELSAMIDEALGRVAAEVVSATPLSAVQEAEIKSKLETLSGKKVDMQTRQDAELLGGVVAMVGDVVYDGSLRTQLMQLRNRMAG